MIIQTTENSINSKHVSPHRWSK